MDKSGRCRKIYISILAGDRSGLPLPKKIKFPNEAIIRFKKAKS